MLHKACTQQSKFKYDEPVLKASICSLIFAFEKSVWLWTHFCFKAFYAFFFLESTHFESKRFLSVENFIPKKSTSVQSSGPSRWVSFNFFLPSPFIPQFTPIYTKEEFAIFSKNGYSSKGKHICASVKNHAKENLPFTNFKTKTKTLQKNFSPSLSVSVRWHLGQL